MVCKLPPEQSYSYVLNSLKFRGTIVAKSPGTLFTFLLCTKLSSPSSPQTMLFFIRSTCGSGKISRAQQWLVSHRRNNIVLGGVGVRVLRKDEEIERTKVFHHIFVSVTRTFGDYCRFLWNSQEDELKRGGTLTNFNKGIAERDGNGALV